MKVYVPSSRGGHRARPRWTIHSLYGEATRCGLYPGRHQPVDGERPQGEVKACRRCFPGDWGAQIEQSVNP